MRILVCGSRNFNDYELLKGILNDYRITEIIHGNAKGADNLGGQYGREVLQLAEERIRSFPAEWGVHGKSAGPIRNRRMLEEGRPDMVIAFRGPNSRGTQNMIDQATKAGVPVRIIEI